MSTATAYPIDYSQPRTIWTLSLQLFWTLLAMLPFYLYLTTIVEIPSEGKYLLQYLPISVGIILFFIQVMFNQYWWREEKTFKKRDIFNSGLKSLILTISMFYTIFFFIFGYWIGGTDAYMSELLSDVIQRTMIQLTITLGTILATYLFMQGVQDDSLPGRKVMDSIRNR